jgi:hypothetical protein
MAKIQIEIIECPNGHGFRAIAIGKERVAGGKCCGSWVTVWERLVDADQLTEAIDRANFDAMREQGRKNRAKVNATL